MRVNKRCLEQRVETLERMTGITFGLDWAYGGVRLVRYKDSTRKGGCSDVSLRMNKTQLGEHLSSMITILMITEDKKRQSA